MTREQTTARHRESAVTPSDSAGGRWLTIHQAGEADTPMITRTILGDLRQRLESDPDLSPETPVPFYYMRHRRFVRDIL